MSSSFFKGIRLLSTGVLQVYEISSWEIFYSYLGEFFNVVTFLFSGDWTLNVFFRLVSFDNFSIYSWEFLKWSKFNLFINILSLLNFIFSYSRELLSNDRGNILFYWFFTIIF